MRRAEANGPPHGIKWGVNDATPQLPSISSPLIGESFWRAFGGNRERQFWLLQVVGWTGWAMGGVLSWMYWGAPTAEYWLFVPSAFAGIVVSTGLRFFYRAIWHLAVPQKILTVIVVTYLAAGIWQVTKNAMNAALTGHVLGAELGYFQGILTAGFYPLLCWSGLYFGIKYYQLFQDENAKLLRVSAMAHEAQLKMLRYQLNPHFLFNTLNAISTLILESETRAANQMIGRLSNFLRYSLDSDPAQKVSLSQEVAAMKMYLEIEQVRFEDRLRVEIDVEPDAELALIPSLILQPLVENAIKYAVAQSEAGGTITLSAKVFARELLLELADDGPGIADAANPPKSREGGVGLVNTRDRLQEMYGENHGLTLEHVSPHGLRVCIRVPYETD